MHQFGRILLAVSATLSLLLILALAGLWVRSYFVCDTLNTSNAIALPLNDAARAYARQKGFDPGFIAHHSGTFLHVVNGRILYSQASREVVLTRWDQEYDTKYVNNPIRTRAYLPPTSISLPNATLWNRLGFAAEDRRSTGGSSFTNCGRSWMIPIWLPMLVSAVLPSLWLRTGLRRRQRAHRRANQLCEVCGYDLRSSPGRCPECGVVQS